MISYIKKTLSLYDRKYNGFIYLSLEEDRVQGVQENTTIGYCNPLPF